MMDLSTYLKERSELVDGFLKIRIGVGAISRVDEAMAYSALAGGKLSVEKALIFCPLRPPLK